MRRVSALEKMTVSASAAKLAATEMVTRRFWKERMSSAWTSSYSRTQTAPSVTPPARTGMAAVETKAPPEKTEWNTCRPSSARAASASMASRPFAEGLPVS